MSEERPSRGLIVWRRWKNVLALAILSFVVGYAAVRIEPGPLEDVAFPPDWTFILSALAVVALLVYLSWRRATSALGLRHAHTHPPYWMGIAVGLAVALHLLGAGVLVDDIKLSHEAHYNFLTASYVLGSLPIGALFCTLLFYVVSRTRGTRPPLGSNGKPLPSKWNDDPKPLGDQDLSTWYLDDDPVRSPDKDLFGHRALVRRMARRLSAPEASAQAVVGRLGSGKTTVRELVRVYFEEHPPSPSVEIVAVELWPYETPRAAVEGILDAFVDSFSRDINTSQLNGIPSQYGEVIARITGISKWLPSAIERKVRPPSMLLRDFDDVATAIGKRYVLWVEDLERFAAAGQPDAPGDAGELERLAPIRALLFGLDRLRSITVVTATTDLFRRFDLEKIARYVETVPDLSLRTSRRILSRVRDQWLSDRAVISVPAPRARMDQLGWDERHTIDDPDVARWAATLLGDRIFTFASAVSALANTPRVLKQGLRRAHETWMALKGEIDVDDTLALCVLREASPNAFALIERHSNVLRRTITHRSRDERDPLVAFDDELAKLKLDERVATSVRIIVKYIFREGRERPQTVAASNHTDYWVRFLTVPRIPQQDRDQTVLRELNANDDSQVLARLEDARAAAVEDFSILITDERLARLLAAMIQRRVDEDPHEWPESHAPGLIPLWRIARKRRHDSDAIAGVAAEVERGLEVAAPTNLALLHELVYWFATSSRDLDDLFGATVRDRIKARSIDLLKEIYAGKPERLARSLERAPTFTLVWLCYGMERVREEANDEPFPGWPEFAQTVLDALRASPEVMAEQIGGMLVRANRRLRGPDSWVLDRAKCQTLFGDIGAFLDLYRATTEIVQRTPIIEAVRNEQAEPAQSEHADDDVRSISEPGAVDEDEDDDGDEVSPDESDPGSAK